MNIWRQESQVFHEVGWRAYAFQHPAFQAFKTQTTMVTISDPLWICGTPLVLDAVENLLKVRLQLAAAQQTTGQPTP